jgi:hypothetical protein
MPSKYAEFEEKSYEGPLYNQLERGRLEIFTPGQVLESRVGFDRGLLLAERAVWEVLGFKTAPCGASLPYYSWPQTWGPENVWRSLPRFKMNLFLQAKRPRFHSRPPAPIRKYLSDAGPLWSFQITPHQQALLEMLADRIGARGHVAYASAAFHTYATLFAHTSNGTLVENSTFPSAVRLAGHEAWYYSGPGASGTANPEPEGISEAPLLPRIREQARENPPLDSMDFSWLQILSNQVVETVHSSNFVEDAQTAQFFDDLRTFDRLSERLGLPWIFQAFGRVRLFTARFGLSWFVVSEPIKL